MPRMIVPFELMMITVPLGRREGLRHSASCLLRTRSRSVPLAPPCSPALQPSSHHPKTQIHKNKSVNPLKLFILQLCSLGISNSKLISGQSQLPPLSVTSVWWRCARRFTALPPSQHWAARAASLCARRLIAGQLGWLMAGNCARGAAGQLRTKLVPALGFTYKGMYVVTRWTYLRGLGFRIKRRLWKDIQIF